MCKVVPKKILPKYYNEVISRKRSFDIRKDDDGFQVGDTVEFREWDDERYCYTGRKVALKITFVLRDVPEYGLMRGFCIIGF